MSNPDVTFVVLNWRNEVATRTCVASIERQVVSGSFETIVVDNDSTAASRAALGEGPWQLVCLTGNRGFTGGMNAGAARARGRFIALLNNDIRLPTDWLSRGLRVASDDRVAVIGGPSLSEGSGAPASTLPRVDPRGFVQLTSTVLPRCAVASVDGGHLFIRAAAWRQLGGFDEDFFAYYEDTDLCARALALGWEVVYEPNLRVWHRRGLSSDRVRWRRLFWARRNRTIWLAKHLPAEDWRQAVLTAAMEYLAQAVRGAGEPDDRWPERLMTRSVSLAVCCWVLSHGRWLTGKRRATIASGMHDSGYRRRLTELYEPAPFSPALMAAGDRSPQP